jgi:putative DNA primase/helicase
MMESCLDIALALYERGFTPLWIPLGSKAAKSPGWQSLEQSPERIAREFGRQCNIGVRLGDVLADESTLIGIDVDLDDGPLLRVVGKAIGQPVPVKHGKKGATFIVRMTEPQRTRGIYLRREGKKKRAIDLLGIGSQTVAPPSIHPDTNLPYRWIAGTPLHQSDILDVALVEPSVIAEIEGYCQNPDDKIVALNDMEWHGIGGGGNTHETCHVATASMIARGWTDEQVYARIAREKREACEAAGQPYHWPDEKKTINEWIASAHAKKFDNAGDGTARSHGAYADAFLEQAQPNIRYDWVRSCWYMFNGSHWQADQDPAVRHAIEQFLPLPLRNRGWVEGIAKSLRDKPELAAPVSWDADPSLLATPSGTVELKTGLVRPAQPNDLISRCTNVGPDSALDPTLWLNCMNDWVGEDQAEHNYHQDLAGYLLTGETREHCLPLWLGSGGNGKSKITETYQYVLGTYGGVATDTAFLDTRYRAHSEEIAMLMGYRFVLYSEVDGGWNEGRIKQVTGGESISASFKFGRTFTYTPVFKLIATSNKEPSLRSVGRAMVRRFHVYRFESVIENVDRRLGEKLRDEAPAILAWMIQGAVRYYRDGLKRSPAVEAATKAYLLGTDHIGQWLEDRAELGPPSFRVNRMRAYQDMCTYLEGNGRRYMPDMQTFIRALEERGVVAKRAVVEAGKNPEHSLIGIRLREGDHTNSQPNGMRDF